MRAALKNIANKAERLIHLKQEDVVLDIGCNDGTLLSSYQTAPIYKIGFEPAENLSAYASTITDKLVTDFFHLSAWQRDRDL